MSVQQGVLGTSSERAEDGAPQIHGYWLLIARVAWLIVAMLSVALFIASVPRLYEVALQDEFVNDPGVRSNMASFGLTPEGYVTIGVALRIAGSVAGAGVAALIFRRRSHERVALLVALLLLPLAATDAPWLETLPSPWSRTGTLLRQLWFAAVPLFFFMFPDGRFVPRWTRWIALYWAISQVLAGVFPSPPAELQTLFVALQTLLLVGMIGVFALTPIYRYVRVSSPVQRQQTKWVLLGILAVFVPGLFGLLLSLIFPSLMEGGTLPYIMGQIMTEVGLICIPLSIGVAVLRYRLWDVDPIVNRVLVYGILSAMLVLIYAAGVVLLQQLLRPLVGQESDLAVVASTLAIAALFHPLRRRIQAVIDRRFYRRRYDAARTLQAFGLRLRDQVELNMLSDDLLATVAETLQPAHVSLWLWPPNSPTSTQEAP